MATVGVKGLTRTNVVSASVDADCSDEIWTSSVAGPGAVSTGRVDGEKNATTESSSIACVDEASPALTGERRVSTGVESKRWNGVHNLLSIASTDVGSSVYPVSFLEISDHPQIDTTTVQLPKVYRRCRFQPQVYVINNSTFGTISRYKLNLPKQLSICAD